MVQKKLIMLKPTKQDLADAINKQIHDVIAPDLKILFCGINPGLYTAATGFHFARPGNRFWKALFYGGITDRVLNPSEQDELLKYGYGITNFVSRTTNAAAELSKEEYIAGAENLKAKILFYRPKILAILGIEAYRKGFQKPKAKIGLHDEKIGETKIWVLPNPSGLNAHFTAESIGELMRGIK